MTPLPFNLQDDANDGDSQASTYALGTKTETRRDNHPTFRTRHPRFKDGMTKELEIGNGKRPVIKMSSP